MIGMGNSNVFRLSLKTCVMNTELWTQAQSFFEHCHITKELRNPSVPTNFVGSNSSLKTGRLGLNVINNVHPRHKTSKWHNYVPHVIPAVAWFRFATECLDLPYHAWNSRASRRNVYPRLHVRVHPPRTWAFL